MTRQSKKSFFVSVIFLLTTVVSLMFTYSGLIQMSAALHATHLISDDAENITSLYYVVENIFRQNNDNATIIYSYFLKEQESNDLINALKEYAEFIEIDMEVTHQIIINETNEKIFAMTSNFSGTNTHVVKFMEYLDAIPYYKKNILSDLFVDEDNQWKGNVVIEINIL
jgi:hypothetical protein